MNEAYGAAQATGSGPKLSAVSTSPPSIQTVSEDLGSNVSQLVKRLHDLRERLTNVLLPAERPDDGAKELAPPLATSPHACYLNDVNRDIAAAHRIIGDLCNRLHL